MSNKVSGLADRGRYSREHLARRHCNSYSCTVTAVVAPQSTEIATLWYPLLRTLKLANGQSVMRVQTAINHAVGREAVGAA
ncbi:hypothetical protein PoB_004732700 [Plakobranchus ocellatus]|uniref:Uncharacterized protein n=1 Tax=Plakobranchus ocellatus TaxID=259542 RepID=A0AAV4BPD5_9GAST|nr:hypothetical protein PoB_004732700 [Plakobranchus ocellatus]